MVDKEGRHDAVLNLYYREWWGMYKIYPVLDRIPVGSGEWDAKIKDILYPHSFPEDEARAFLQSMGEEPLKAKLLEEINDLGSKYQDKTIDLFFFGFDIGTCQNGEIVLKP